MNWNNGLPTTSPDSMSPFGKGGINPYAYCEGDPINNTDPTGRFRVVGFLEGVGDIALGVITDDPELIAGGVRRDVQDEEGHLAARSVRQTASRATRPRASSVSAEAERAIRSRMVRENRAIREAQRPGPSNIRPHPSTNTRMRGFLAELNNDPSARSELSPDSPWLAQQNRIHRLAHDDAASIVDAFKQRKMSYETSRRMLENLNPLNPWTDLQARDYWNEEKEKKLRFMKNTHRHWVWDARDKANMQKNAETERVNNINSPEHPLRFMSDFFDD